MCSLYHTSCPPDYYTGAVTFIVGTLDGDPVNLSLLKDHVSHALYNLGSSLRVPSFNIIHCSHKISKFCDRAVTWSPDTASQALSWIRSLVCGSGASPTNALSAAFEDPSCQAVYLVIDALPPSLLQEIYGFLSRDDSACSVNVVYLLEKPCDSLAEGSFRMINLKPLGSLNKIRINGNQRYSPCCSSSSSCTSSTIQSSEHQMPPFSCILTSREPPVSCAMNGGPAIITPEALSLLRGARVLARRDTDSLYYLGHIAREVEGSCDRFLVEFEKCLSLKGKGQFRMQETSVCDIIHYEDARWRPLDPGDHVLAPVDGSLEKYGPGTVLQGTESRVCGLASDSGGILVTFWNGKTKKIAPGLAVWIPQTLSDRITLELHIPLEARKKLMESCPGFPFIGSADKHHPASQTEDKVGGPGSHTCLYCRHSAGVCRKCQVPEELWAALRTSLSHISQMTSSKGKPSKKVDKEKAPKQNISPKPVYGKEKNRRPKTSVIDQRDHQKAEQISRHKERLVCSRDTQTEKNIDPYTPIESNVKRTEGDTMKSSYKSSTSSLDNMTHLQATLQRIDQAMKEDRLAMESAILERRPRSTPLKRNYEAKVPRFQEPRERKEGEQAELRRIQEEERRRRREEKNWEIEQNDVMLKDNRLCSEQRILLDLERRQDNEGLEAPQVESRRSRKKEQDLGREYRKEEQRVTFWSDLQQPRENLDLGKSQKRPEQNDEHNDLVQSRMMTRQRRQEADLQDWRRHQRLQAGATRRVSKRLERFYHQAEQESRNDTDLQQYLKDHNLQAVRSGLVL
ncbi:uncharacterized protein LOC142149603 [Mixophyes fleayi]|uniref:uncharacterized protein LOC142149603 n=1 Tax=Mixophyes fleayi TaxID=3061075 RepID=UPI003F4E1D24